MTWRMLDLFSGLAGFTLAAHEVWGHDLETVSFVEIDKRCREFLSRAWPGVPIHDDIRTLEAICQEFVRCVGSERYLQVTQDVNLAIQLIQETGETIIENLETRRIENIKRGESEKSLIIMVENVPVVGKINWSSFVLIILKIMEMRNANSIVDQQRGELQLNVNSQMTTKSFATTATMQNRCMGYVHIKDRIDLLTAGVPCQDASRAGKQRGSKGDRWFWPQTIKMCEIFLPTWVLFENHPGIGDVGLDGILSALEGIGYEVQTVDIPACAVNAPHRRHRYWIICFLDNSDRRLRGKKSAVCTGRTSTAISTQSGRSAQGSPGHSDFRSQDHFSVADHMLYGSEHERQQDHGVKQGASWSESDRCSEDGWRQRTDGVLQEHTTETRLEERQPDQDRLQNPAQRYVSNPWSSYIWLPCADGKVSRSPDDSQRMAHGLPVELSEALGEEGRENWTPEDCEPHRSLLAALGNSIVPQVAIEIMKAIKEVSK